MNGTLQATMEPRRPDLGMRPCCRPELVIRRRGEGGPYVVSDRATGAYFHLGAEEHFLLTQLDGSRDVKTICDAYAGRFQQALAEEDLDEFVKLAEAQGFLEAPSVGQPFQPDVAATTQDLPADDPHGRA